jgi:hypothetical protein
VANQKNISEVKAPNIITNNKIAIEKVSKKTSVLIWLASIILFLVLAGWVTVITLILFRMYL